MHITKGKRRPGGLRGPGVWFLGWLLCLPACGADDEAGGAPDASLSADASGLADATVGGGLDGGDNAPDRWLELDGVVNARDLGGYAVTGGALRWRQLLRGGTLSSLTTAGCQAFAELGVTTVIDLREAGEQSSAPPAACVTANATVVSAAMPKLLPASEANYLSLMDQSESAVVTLFDAVGQADAGPVYVHCVIGRDRASWAAALLLLAAGADRATVLADFLLSNDAGIAVDAAHLEAILDAIDAEGGDRRLPRRARGHPGAAGRAGRVGGAVGALSYSSHLSSMTSRRVPFTALGWMKANSHWLNCRRPPMMG